MCVKHLHYQSPRRKMNPAKHRQLIFLCCLFFRCWLIMSASRMVAALVLSGNKQLAEEALSFPTWILCWLSGCYQLKGNSIKQSWHRVSMASLQKKKSSVMCTCIFIFFFSLLSACALCFCFYLHYV